MLQQIRTLLSQEIQAECIDKLEHQIAEVRREFEEELAEKARIEAQR